MLHPGDLGFLRLQRVKPFKAKYEGKVNIEWETPVGPIYLQYLVSEEGDVMLRYLDIYGHPSDRFIMRKEYASKVIEALQNPEKNMRLVPGFEDSQSTTSQEEGAKSD